MNKVFLLTIIGTLVLLIGGVFFMTRGNTSSPAKKINSEVLAPADSQQSSPSASITLVEFGDYQCPACGVYHPLIKQLLTELEGKVNFVFRDYPLSQHKNSMISSYAANAAGLQGKFWQMHDKLYETQKDWSDSSDPKKIFIDYAQSLGLDIKKFETDMGSDTVKKIVEKGTNDGNLVGLSATPTFYLNGIKMELVGSYDEFKKAVISAK